MKTIKNLTAEQIRKSILQLAIQGKLVKQDPNDEPASELVKRIYEEKQRLIKEGKLKKDKNESYIYKGDDNCYYEKVGKEVRNITDDLPFEIHDNWTWIRLSNYCYLNGGYAFKSNNFSNEGIRVIRISDFDEDGIKSKEIKRYPYSNEMDKSKIEVNDIIVCMTGGTVGKSLYIKQLEEPSYLNQRVALIRTKDKLSDYLATVFKSPYIQELVKDNITSTNDNISMNFLNNILIPIPPFNEQLRIQSKLLYYEPLIKNYEYLERQLTQLESTFEERLKASILQYAIEGKLVKQDPNDEPASILLERIEAEKEKLIKEGKIKRDKSDYEIVVGDDKNYYVSKALPASWVLVKAKQLTKKIQYGLSISGQKNGKYKLLRITDIQKGKVNWNTLPFCDISEQKYIDYKIERDDIFIARTGGTIGKSFRLVESKENVVFAGYLIRFQLLFNTLSEYISRYLNSPAYWKQVSDKSMGTGQPNINGVSLGNLVIPLPPVSEQKRINNKINKLFCIIKSY